MPSPVPSSHSAAQSSARRAATQARSAARVLASVLSTVFRERRPADRALAACLRAHREFGSRDRHLFSAIVFAVLRWWGWIRFLGPDPNSLTDADNDQARLDKLGAVIFAALCMEDIPASPEFVALLERICGLRKPPDGVLDDPDPMARGAALFGADMARVEALVPDWVLPELPCQDEMHRLLLALQQRPPLWLRAQGCSVEQAICELRKSGVEAAAEPRLPGAIRLSPTRVNLYTVDAYRRGLVEVQDLASQATGLLCDPKPRQRWWDCCAGAGGKSLLLAEAMDRTGTVVATDIREYKLTDLRKRARRAGFPNIHTRAWNGAPPRGRRASFDGVLVDAPCTCSGTWRRNPDARWSTRPEDLAEMAETQARILRHAARGVRPGGCLVYATCSLFPRENEAVVRGFLDQHAEFSLCRVPHPLTGDPTQGMVHILPWQGDCDAMFAARMTRAAHR